MNKLTWAFDQKKKDIASDVMTDHKCILDSTMEDYGYQSHCLWSLKTLQW